MPYLVVTHGGASSTPDQNDGPRRAARRAIEVMRQGGSVLDAAVEACADLEDDPRFNAGTGSNLRFDGKTIEMDAACMQDDGRFGAVCNLRRVKNPIRVAQAVLRTPHVMLTGEGAERFAQILGFPDHDPWTEIAQKKYDKLREQLRLMHLDPEETAWKLPELEKFWNYPRPLKHVAESSDTVGSVVTDGKRYAAALSTGGTMGTLLGRVGDVPLPGCGLQVGRSSAVACTGDGDELARAQLANRVHRFLQDGMSVEEAVKAGVEHFPLNVAVGIIAIKGFEGAAFSNRTMAYAIEMEAE